MTSQQRADSYLHAWQLLRVQGVSANARLPVIDALCEIERAKNAEDFHHCDHRNRTDG